MVQIWSWSSFVTQCYMFRGFFNFPCCSLSRERRTDPNRTIEYRPWGDCGSWLQSKVLILSGMFWNLLLHTNTKVGYISVTKWFILNYYLLQKVVCPDLFCFRKYQVVLDVYGICLGGSQTAGGTGGLQSSTWADADTALFGKVWQETRGRSANWPKSWWLRSGAYSLIALSFKDCLLYPFRRKYCPPTVVDHLCLFTDHLTHYCCIVLKSKA